MNNQKNIVLCGVGGQGTVLASKLLAAAAMSKDIPVISPRKHTYNVKKYSEGITFERLYRRTCDGHSNVHHRKQCHRASDRQGIRSQQEYGTYGCNNMEQKEKRIIWKIV